MTDRHQPGTPEQDARIAALRRQLAAIEAELLAVTGEPPAMRLPAASALAEGELRFRRLTAHLPCLVFELAPDGTTLFANEAITMLTGYTPEAVRGKNWWVTFFPAERLFDAYGLRRRLAAGDIAGEMMTLIARDGRPVELTLHTANQYGAEGQLQRVMGLGQPAVTPKPSPGDVRLSAEVKLHILGHIVRQSPDIIIIADTQYRICLTNLLSRIQQQITLDQVLGKPIGEVVDEVVGEEYFETVIRAHYDRALRGEVVSFEKWDDRPGQERRYYETYYFPILGAEGVEFVVSILHDATARKLAETERERLLADVHRRAAELDATINAMTDGLLIYDTELRLIRLNPAALRITGLSEEQAQGKTLAAHLAMVRACTTDGKPFSLSDEPFAGILQRNEPLDGLVLQVTTPARTVWVSASFAPIVSPDGTVLGAVVSFSDISALHALQERQQLFLHTISHDLRAPVTIILGNAQLLETRLAALPTAEERAPEYLATIIRNARRMNVMIADLVDAARLEGGQLTLQSQPVHLQAYFHELFQRSQAVLQHERIVLELPADLPPVQGDPDRLDRVFLNLLSNAQKYAPPETPIHVSATCGAQDVHIAVRDHGPGIDPEDLPHLFTQFYRAKHLPRKAEGIGLGLYITRILVEAHGGRIWVESVEGEGSTFMVALPMA